MAKKIEEVPMKREIGNDGTVSFTVAETGRVITVKDGKIAIPGMKLIDAKTAGSMIELNELPPKLKKYAKEHAKELKGRIWFGSTFMPPAIAEEAERQFAKIQEAENPENRIEGLRELQDAIAAEENYFYQFDKMMSNPGNDGANPPNKPEVNSGELRKKYPRAAAYLKLLNNGWPFHAERILKGEDYQMVIADMEKEKQEATTHAALFD
jgi:hypothetical protein